MAGRIQCEFQLIRYVPDPVKDEFVNIGVLLRASSEGQHGEQHGQQRALRLTRDWRRVRCLDPDADIPMLEALEIEISHRLQAQTADHPKPILGLLETSLSNGLQITTSKAYLAESFAAGLEELMRLLVDSPKREAVQRRAGRAAVLATMRRRFEDAGVWSLMQKQVAAAIYTLPGDPLRIDCSYSNGMVKMFQAISLETNADDAKLLAYAAPQLKDGVQRIENKDLLLTAIAAPIGWPEGDAEPSEERGALYDYVTAIFDQHQIRFMSTTDLPNLARTAREELRV